jgi:hypothetical protein
VYDERSARKAGFRQAAHADIQRQQRTGQWLAGLLFRREALRMTGDVQPVETLTAEGRASGIGDRQLNGVRSICPSGASRISCPDATMQIHRKPSASTVAPSGLPIW